jgi:hypothetical protein
VNSAPSNFGESAISNGSVPELVMRRPDEIARVRVAARVASQYHTQHENMAGSGPKTPGNATQTDKKCLHTEGDVARYESLLVRGPNGRKWGLDPKRVTAEMLEAEGIKKAPLLSVMRAMCLDCRPADEVAVCARPYCPLWPYRDGTSPWKRDDRD